MIRGKGTKGKKLTPEQVASIVALWTVEANASEVARQVGCAEGTVRNYVIRRNLAKANEFYARAIDRGEREGLALVAKARRKVSVALDTARGTKAIADLTRAAVASLQGATNTKLAHARITGTITDPSAPVVTVNLVIHFPTEDDPEKPEP